MTRYQLKINNFNLLNFKNVKSSFSINIMYCFTLIWKILFFNSYVQREKLEANKMVFSLKFYTLQNPFYSSSLRQTHLKNTLYDSSTGVTGGG